MEKLDPRDNNKKRVVTSTLLPLEEYGGKRPVRMTDIFILCAFPFKTKLNWEVEEPDHLGVYV